MTMFSTYHAFEEQERQNENVCPRDGDYTLVTHLIFLGQAGDVASNSIECGNGGISTKGNHGDFAGMKVLMNLMMIISFALDRSLA